MTKTHKSQTSHAILDSASRKRKAEKIARILRQKKDISQSHLLDIGTGAGYIANHIAQYVGAVTSVDLVDERQVVDGYTFKQVTSELLPFPSATFDIVLSNHVIEHVHDQQKHVDEILRVLKPGGIAYFATPNRRWPIDPHYRLLFINWMPRKMATNYLQTVSKKVWDIKPITTRHLHKYVGKQHAVDSVIVDIIKNPEQYHLDTLKPIHPITRRSPRFVLKAISGVSPTILVTVIKFE
jgi:2-polyprenyl-3-methyl-5-hydroxy-6-metoxy-1,4-benzoquinol methylase